MGITGTIPAPNPLEVTRIEIVQAAYDNRQAGEDISAYEIVYLDGTLIKKADASNINKMPAVGMALASGLMNETIDVCFRGIIANPAWNFTSGVALFLMSGGVIGHNAPDTSGNVIQGLGQALTKTAIHFDPEDSIMVVGI